MESEAYHFSTAIKAPCSTSQHWFTTAINQPLPASDGFSLIADIKWYHCRRPGPPPGTGMQRLFWPLFPHHRESRSLSRAWQWDSHVTVYRGGRGVALLRNLVRKPSISLRVEVEGSLGAAPQISVIKFPAVSKQICFCWLTCSQTDKTLLKWFKVDGSWNALILSLNPQIRLDKLPFKIILPGWNTTGPIGSLWGERGGYCALKKTGS